MMRRRYARPGTNWTHFRKNSKKNWLRMATVKNRKASRGNKANNRRARVENRASLKKPRRKRVKTALNRARMENRKPNSHRRIPSRISNPARVASRKAKNSRNQKKARENSLGKKRVTNPARGSNREKIKNPRMLTSNLVINRTSPPASNRVGSRDNKRASRANKGMASKAHRNRTNRASRRAKWKWLPTRKISSLTRGRRARVARVRIIKRAINRHKTLARASSRMRIRAKQKMMRHKTKIRPLGTLRRPATKVFVSIWFNAMGAWKMAMSDPRDRSRVRNM